MRSRSELKYLGKARMLRQEGSKVVCRSVNVGDVFCSGLKVSVKLKRKLQTAWCVENWLFY